MRTRAAGILAGVFALSAGCGSGGGDGGPFGPSAIGFSNPVRTDLPDFVSVFGGLAVGHFDGDAFPDAAVGREFAPLLDLLLGRGDGTFEIVAPVAAGVPGNQSDLVRAAFLNLDAFTDLVVADGEHSLVQTLLGRGDGTFDPGMALPVEFLDDLVGLEVGRLDGDVLDDVALVEAGGPIHVLLSVGDGTLVPGPGPIVVPGADRLDVGFLGGGLDELDLLVSDTSGGAIYLFEGLGTGAFVPLGAVLVPEGPTGAAVTDVGVDSRAIVVCTATPVGARVFVPTGPGTYAPAPQGLVPLPGTFAVDVVVLPAQSLFALDDILVLTVDAASPDQFATHVTRLRLDIADPGRVTATTETRDGSFAAKIVVADMDADGVDDLVTTGFLESFESFLEVRFGL